MAENKDLEHAAFLSFANVERYTRQIIVDEIGLEGQKELFSAKVLVVGCGGLGSPVLMYLAAAGIGYIGLSDGDAVELSNLNRQTLFKERDIGKSKAETACKYIEEANSNVRVIMHPKITKKNAWSIFKEYNLVIDCADSRSLRYLLSDCASIKGIPFVCGSSLRWDGAIHVLKEMCYRCIYPKKSQKEVATCASAGVIGGVCGAVGSALAVEAIKSIVGVSASYMVQFNLLRSEWIRVSLEKRKTRCFICQGKGEKTTTELKDMAGIEEDLHTTEKPIHTADNLAKLNLYNKIKKESSSTIVTWESILNSIDTYILVDIRSAEEQKMLSVPNSFLYPVADIIDNPFKSIRCLQKKAEGRAIALFCRNGKASQRFALLLSGVSIDGGAQAYNVAARKTSK